MTIKEIAKQVGLKPHTVRYYESLGLIKPIRKENNYREYTEQDLYKLQSIIVLQHASFDLKSIQLIMESMELEASEECNQRVNALFYNKIDELTLKIKHFKALIKLLKAVPLAPDAQTFNDNKPQIEKDIALLINNTYHELRKDLKQ